MPVFLPNNLPAARILMQENPLLCGRGDADRSPNSHLKVAILNLMPTKEVTEVQLLRLLGSSPYPIDITLLHAATHQSKNTAPTHLAHFYTDISCIEQSEYDGLIITGAPVEQIAFEDVDYWPELCRIMEWSKTHVRSTLHICWGAQAGLYYHYGIDKHLLPAKLSGIYSHHVLQPHHPLLCGFDDLYFAPHSRYTGVSAEKVAAADGLSVLTISDDAGLHIAADQTGRRIFVTGHSEYDPDTLAKEYTRDVGRGINPHVPVHYFPDDDPTQPPVVQWRGHAHLLFTNWLHYFAAPQA